MSELKTAVVEHNGQRYELKYRPITRYLRNQAMEVAAMEGMKRFGKAMPLVSEAELFLVGEIVKGGLDANPRIWWVQNQDFALGDKISMALGVEAALMSLKGDNTPEVEAAKNSSGGDEPSQAQTPSSLPT